MSELRRINSGPANPDKCEGMSGLEVALAVEMAYARGFVQALQATQYDDERSPPSGAPAMQARAQRYREKLWDVRGVRGYRRIALNWLMNRVIDNKMTQARRSTSVESV